MVDDRVARYRHSDTLPLAVMPPSQVVSTLVDHSQTPIVVDAIFRYADPASFIALRVFPHEKGQRALW